MDFFKNCYLRGEGTEENKQHKKVVRESTVKGIHVEELLEVMKSKKIRKHCAVIK